MKLLLLIFILGLYSSCNGDFFTVSEAPDHSTITGSSLIVADGLQVSTVTITILDSKKQPKVGVVPQFKATDSASTNIYQACSTSDSSGISICSFSSRKAEVKTLTLTSPYTRNGGTVEFIAGAADVSKSEIEGTGPVLADGDDVSNIKITLKDIYENPVKGIVPTFSATDFELTNIQGACSVTNAAGISTCTLASLEGETKVLSIATPIIKVGESVVFDEIDYCTGNTSNSPFAVGDGTPANPYGICTAAQFNNIGVNPLYLDKHFRLYAHVDLASFTANSFQLIGSLAAPFTGTFNGGRKIVSNFTFNDNLQDYVGLFRRIGGTGLVKNLGMTSATVVGQTFVGALVGENTGIVSNCYAKGNVTGSSRVGGLAGRFWETDATSTIKNSYAEGTVTGADFVGGLTGWMRGSISKNYAKGNVIATGDRIGGLVGTADIGNVYDSYTEGNVTGRSYVGGVVGIIDGYVSGTHSITTINCTSYCGGVLGVTTAAAKKISTSYSQATITSTGNFVGGLVGYTGTGFQVENSYATFTNNSATSDRAGGLIGYAAGPVTNVYAVPMLIGGVGTYRGGVAGRVFSTTITGGFWNNEYDLTIPVSTGASTTLVMKTAQTYIDAGWSTSIWNLQDGSYPTLK
jgi:hypothetical protein